VGDFNTGTKRKANMVKFLLIAAGGGVGALLRYLIAGWGQTLVGGWFPLGTLIVNTAGCLIIGALGAYFAGPQLIREEYRIALLVGVLGAFTTFSTFSWETLSLARDGELRLAMVNVVLTNVLALTAVWLGYRFTEKWFGA
jgi:CrcB protein